MDITNSPRPTGDEEGQASGKLANREGESMQSGPACLCNGQGGSKIEEPIVTIQRKLALAELLRTWRSYFGDNWFTAEQAIHYLHDPEVRDLLCQIGIAIGSGDADELSKRLDEVRNKVIYNFVVKRDMPYMQPVKWRVLLQDSRVKISAEEGNDFIEVRRKAGLKIDPATAEIHVSSGNYFDPYGIIGYDNLPEQCRGYGAQTLYWARSPGSDIWVEFGDLPDETREALWNVLKTRSHERQRGQGRPDEASPLSAA